SVSDMAVEAPSITLLDHDCNIRSTVQFPLAAEFGMEFGSHGFYNIKIGGFPSILLYAFRDGRQFVIIQSTGTMAFKRHLHNCDSDEEQRLHEEKLFAASRYLFRATLDSIQWYGPKGRRLSQRNWSAIKALQDNELMPPDLYLRRKEQVSSLLKQKCERDQGHYETIKKVAQEHRWRFRL
ncbi:MAG: hypothetical protein AAF968_10945, partial [Pseudomonadota bacterium]